MDKKEILAKEARHGMPKKPFKSLEHLVSVLTGMKCLLGKKDGQFHRVDKSFKAHFNSLKDVDAGLEAFWTHEHYIWHSARARALYGTVEFRPACQQPHAEGMVVSAFSLGLVEAWKEIEARMNELGPEAWTQMQAYLESAVREGLKAKEPEPGLLKDILELCQEGLVKRGLGEEKFLQPLFDHLRLKKNPGQSVRKLVEDGDIKGLIQKLAYP